MNAELLLSVLGEILLKSAGLWLIAAVIVKLWRSASAAQQAFVWLAFFLALLLLPLTRLSRPQWAIPLGNRVHLDLPVSMNLRVTDSKVEVAPVHSNPSPEARSFALPDWRKMVLGIWLGGAGVALVSRLFGQWQLDRLRRRSAVLQDSPALRIAEQIRNKGRSLSKVEFRTSGECRVPMTWGARRPVILLPAEALRWNGARLAAALRHEAGHILRHDYLTRWLASIAKALFWPNPLVWLAARSLQIAQEQATDDLVLQSGTAADEYASLLFETARAASARGSFAGHAVAMASPSTLERRILAIVDDGRSRRAVSQWMALTMLSAVGLVLGLCTIAQVQAADVEPIPTGPQVEIEARFVEIDPSKKPTNLNPTDGVKVWPDPAFQVIMRTLNQRKGVDLLTTPRLTTRSKQRAELTATREFQHPSDWEKDPANGEWKATKTATKNVGVTLEIVPEIQPDGTLKLHLKPTVTDFLGFIDLDTGKGEFSETPGPGKRLKPVFSERSLEVETTMKSGETVELTGLKETADVQALDSQTARKTLVVFVSARVLEAAPKPAELAAPNTTPTAQTEANQPDPGPTLEALRTKVELLQAALDRLAIVEATKILPPDPKFANGHFGSTEGDIFVSAYLQVQKGEKLELQGQFAKALTQMKEAAEKFHDLAQQSPHWQPSIVAYRTKKTEDAVKRLEAKQ